MRLFWLALLSLVTITFARSALAHQTGLSRGEYRIENEMLVAEIILARGELASALPRLDENGDGKFSQTELSRGRISLATLFTERTSVRASEGPCKGILDDAFAIEEDGIVLRSLYRCPAPPRMARVRLEWLDDLAQGHRHIARAITSNEISEHVLVGKTRDLLVVADTHPIEKPAPKTNQNSFFGFFQMGMEHIVLGYDHLVFLFGLVLVGGRIRSLVAVITAFTLAHSITLGLAALSIWAPPSRVIEPLIALSIAYVGVENLYVKDAEKRYRITFPFGLIHGFGFAGALQEISLPKTEIPKALLGFNLGVEAGQLLALLLVLPLLHYARKNTWFVKRGVRLLSYGIVALGLVWLVARIVTA